MSICFPNKFSILPLLWHGSHLYMATRPAGAAGLTAGLPLQPGIEQLTNMSPLLFNKVLHIDLQISPDSLRQWTCVQ